MSNIIIPQAPQIIIPAPAPVVPVQVGPAGADASLPAINEGAAIARIRYAVAGPGAMRLGRLLRSARILI